MGLAPHLITANYSGDTNFNPSSGSQSITVNPKALTMTGLAAALTKVYDATTVAGVTGTAVLQASEPFGTGLTTDGKPYTGDIVSITGTPIGTYNSKDVATAASVAFSGLSLTGDQAGNYTLTPHAPAAAAITVKPLTMSGLSVPPSKIYNGNLAAVVSGTPVLEVAELPGVGTAIDGKPYTVDTVNIVGPATGTYNSPDVATATTVTFGGLTLGGGQAGNYLLTIPAPVGATITVRNLTVSAAGINKVYDGTLAATVTLSDDRVSGDIFTDSYGAASFIDKNVGTGKAVSVSGLSILGADAANYNLVSMTAATTANITPAALSIKADDASKRNGTTKVFTGHEFTTNPSPLYDGDSVDSVTLTSAGSAPEAADGPHDIVPSAATGTGLGNYTISYVVGTLTVTSINTAPVITEGDSVPVSMSVNGNPTAFVLSLNATDLDGDTLTWSISTNGMNGTASVPASDTGNSMAISYVPTHNYTGTDSFVVAVNDGFGGSDTITVNVSIGLPSLTFTSVGAQDGWILESGESSNLGGTLNGKAATFNLGDDALNKQYRAILSFDTSSLPANAVITNVTLKITQSGLPKGKNPFLKLGNIAVDIKNGTFSKPTLQLGDFSAKQTLKAGMTITNSPVSGVYSATLGASANTLINRVGPTQFRLRFTKDDNNNLAVNYLKFFSGNSLTGQPQLVIQYYVP